MMPGIGSGIFPDMWFDEVVAGAPGRLKTAAFQ